MKYLLKIAAVSVAVFAVASPFIYGKISLNSGKTPEPTFVPARVDPSAQPKIQAAILLDVSNSMDGLIEQAKAQLWNMVSVMGRAECNNGQPPQIEIALYEYGRTDNDAKAGFVKQISAFSSDLDKISQDLFRLTTNGGDEYCGQVIFTSLKDLKWDTAAANYKVIFIAGNEDFLQGDLHYVKACALAKQNGVIVNTIYCGDRASGIREHWNLNAECGTGSFTNINQDEKTEDIPTPYDSLMLTLNDRLNNTYIGYGAAGRGKKEMQTEMDQANYSNNKASAVKRAEVKSKGNLYKNESWDLVDAASSANGSEVMDKIRMETLPDSLRKKTKEQLKVFVAEKGRERTALQKEMASVSIERNAWLADEKKKRGGNRNPATLETAMEKIIREQANKVGMKVD